MKTIIAGSRKVTSFNDVVKAIREAENVGGIHVTEVVSGTARGVDRLGEDWARWTNTKCKRFWPNWKKHGKGAGIIRNSEMAEYAEALIAVLDKGECKGTKNMIKQAKEKGIKTYVKKIR